MIRGTVANCVWRVLKQKVSSSSGVEVNCHINSEVDEGTGYGDP